MFSSFFFQKSTQEIGIAGETAALSYLQKNKYTLIARNWRCPLGELDLIMLHGEYLVFVEVKARRGLKISKELIFANIHQKKIRKIKSLIDVFLYHQPKLRAKKIRIDIIGIYFNSDNSIKELIHLPGAY